ncbi:MAG TPA: tetratricopeptide repeat protein [Candidatus Polarisedimenticolia bacterium]|jgi:Flp pilus assembly protein TadD|nr:tetratricopeptide repeat protein [Candidatus Polarisedimenticolia bacterium]
MGPAKTCTLLAALVAAALVIPGCRKEAKSSPPPEAGLGENLPKGPERGGLLLNRGIRFLADGQNDEAIKVLEMARQADPSAARIALELGRAYQRDDKFEKAEAILRELLDAPATRAEDKLRARELLVEVLLAKGSLPEAKKACAPLLEGDDVSATARRLSGMIAYREGDVGRAVAELNEAARLAPADAETRTALGVALLQAGDLPGAAAALEQAEKLDPDSQSAVSNLQKVYERQGKKAEAEAARKRFQEIYDRKSVRQKVGPLRSKGVEAYNAGRLDEALEAFQEILKMAPRDPQALAHAGSVYFSMQKLGEAEDYLKRALDVRPDDDFALTQMARIRALRDDLPGAIDLLQRAARSNPESPEPHYFLAGIYYAQGSKGDFLREKAAFERLRINTPMPGVMELPEVSGK